MENAPTKIELFKCNINTQVPCDINHFVELGKDILKLRKLYPKLLDFECSDNFLNAIGFIDDSIVKELLNDKY